MKIKQLDNNFIKIGRIKSTTARKAHIKSADVVIDTKHIRHIEKQHANELAILAISALDYVKIVVSTFSEIRQNKNNSILLVKINEDREDDTVTLVLVLNIKKHLWEVKTAQPRRDLRNNKLLYAKKTKANPKRKSLV